MVHRASRLDLAALDALSERVLGASFQSTLVYGDPPH